MIRAIQSPSLDRPVFALTRRGVIGLLVGAAVMFTAIVLLVIALVGQHHQGVQIKSLTMEDGTLIAGLAGEVSRERAQVVAARDAYCRLKHYETLSGGAVLRIAASFHLLSPRAQARWRNALEAVERIPAASSCSGAPVGLKASGSPQAHSPLRVGEALPAVSVQAPTAHSAPAHGHGNPPHQAGVPVSPPSQSPPAQPSVAAPVPTSTPPIVTPSPPESHGHEDEQGAVEAEVGIGHGPRVHIGWGKGH